MNGALSLTANPNLQTVEMPALRIAGVSSGPDVSINDNVKLDCTVVEAVVCGLDPNPNVVDTLRNDADNNNDAEGESCVMPTSCVAP